MIDILPSPRSAIFTDTATRKLPRSFYWGAGVALLLHAGLIYYLVQQNFNLATGPEVHEPPIIGTLYNPPPPEHPKPQTQTQKPVSQVAVHTPPLDPTSPTDNTTLTPNNVTTVTTDGPPTLQPPPVTDGPGTNMKTDPVDVTPRWKAFPDAAALTDYYPARAIDNEMEGTASVQCTVLDTAGHVRCTVVSESPKGYGFGQQTVKMVEDKGRVDTSAGDIKIGSVLSTTTVKWQLN